MAAPKLYKIKSATFKAKAIASAQSMELSIESAEQVARGDGAVAMQLAYVEGVHCRVSIMALEGSVTDSDLTLPSSGVLVVVCFEQASGVGAAAAGDQTFTFPVATSKGPRRSAPLDGNPSVSFDFIAVAPSGDVADLYAVT